MFLVWRERKVRKAMHAGAMLVGWESPCSCWLRLRASSASWRAGTRRWTIYWCSLPWRDSSLLIAGWRVFRRVFWILLFLFLMVPLPARVHNLISLPLQSIATTGSVVLLEACGTSVSQQGNIVTLNGDTALAVAEACSGLRMLIAFVIAAALIAYLVKRPRWQKAVLLASSIPVAVICNVIRIFATALLMLYVDSKVGQKFFHDIGGFVMIAIAVSLLFGEIRLMDRLIVSESGPQPGQVIVSARSAAKGQAKSARNKP